MHHKVKLVEVGPRDGLQNETKVIPTAIKIELIERLAASGLKTIESTSFVSHKKIPQLADATEVLKGINRKPHVQYPVLVPNIKGFEDALHAGAKEIAIFGAASETFSQKNINCSIDESLERFSTVLNEAQKHDIPVRGYISCVLGCPYEGKIATEAVVDIANAMKDMGCYEISLGDTIGIGTPHQAQALIKTVAKSIPLDQLAVHFHDTFGQALANIFACLECGVHIIDSSVAGLGGCPYAAGASGNVATEEVLYMLNGLGIQTDVDFEKIVDTANFICNALDITPRSKVTLALQD